MKLKNRLGFKRTNRFNEEKQPPNERKDWLSACGQFRIRWHCVFQGVNVSSAYYAMRLNRRPMDNMFYWDFATERKPYRTFKKAVMSCYKSAGIIGTRATRVDKGKSRIPLAERIHKMVGNRLSKAEIRIASAERDAGKIAAAERAAEEEVKQAAIIAAAMPKKRGRPPGSKNKSKAKRKQRSDKGKSRGKRTTSK